MAGGRDTLLPGVSRASLVEPSNLFHCWIALAIQFDERCSKARELLDVFPGDPPTATH